MNDCQHQQGEHYLGDCGDLIATHDGLQLPADGQLRTVTFTGDRHDQLAAWLRLQGVIQ